MDKKILKTLSEIKEWFATKSEMLSFDWETTGLGYMTMEPVGVSFSDGNRVCYIDLWENPEYEFIKDFLGSNVFSSKIVLFIAHNAKFDVKCCRKFLGFYPTNVYCTYIASYLLDENRSSHTLKFLAIQDLSIPENEVEKWEKASSHGYHSEQFYRYCFNDSIWAFQLYELYTNQLHEQGLDYVFYEIEMPFVFVCADMEINGIKVDTQALYDLEFKTRMKLIELEDRMFKSVSLKVVIQERMFDLGIERILPINLRSGPALMKLLKKYCGITVKDVKKESIEALKGKHPFIDYLLDYKKVRKLYDAYIKPAFGLIDSDGRIHPNFGIVKTGRTNCRNPNLQQLPNLSKKFSELNYRAIFIADDVCQLVGGDYSSQELRVLGEVSGDVNIIESFRRNYDLHLVTANYIFSLGLDNLSLEDGTDQHKLAVGQYKSERYKAKNGVNFPIVYGSSEYGISYKMGVSVETAKEWRKKFFELYPEVLGAIQQTRMELEDNQYITTMMGRRRRFPDYEILPNFAKGKTPNKSRCVRQAFNFKIQGFSADQVKIAAAIVRKAGLKILMIVHDEIVCESSCPQQDARILKACMEHAVQLSIPFIVDCKVGGRYSELK